MQRELSFTTDIAVSAAVMARLLRELGVGVGVEAPTTASPDEDSAAVREAAHAAPRVGRFLRTTRVQRAVRGASTGAVWDNSSGRYPVMPADIPRELPAVLDSIQQTPFAYRGRRCFLAPTNVPLHFNAPAALRSDPTRGAAVLLRVKWRVQPAHGPRTLLEEEAWQQQRRIEGGRTDDADEATEALPCVFVEVRLQVVSDTVAPPCVRVRTPSR